MLVIFILFNTCDSLINSLHEFLRKQTDEKLSNATDIVIYSDEATRAAYKKKWWAYFR